MYLSFYLSIYLSLNAGAGSMDSFEIYVWSVQTAKLLDVLQGHEGPITGVSFNPSRPVLVSSSWDGTVRSWEIFGSGKEVGDVYRHNCEILTVAYRPDGKRK
jgi:periodic tryptophan protein 2